LKFITEWRFSNYTETEGLVSLSQTPATFSYPDHALPLYFLKLNFDIIPSAPSSSEWFLSLKFLPKLLYTYFVLHQACHMLHTVAFSKSEPASKTFPSSIPQVTDNVERNVSW